MHERNPAQTIRPAGLRYDRPSPSPTPIPTLLARAGIVARWPTLAVGELSRTWDVSLTTLLRLERWLQTPQSPCVYGSLDDLPFRSGVLQAAVLDHAMPLLRAPATALGEVVRAMRIGARILIRERDWRWEMAGKETDLSTSFRRFGGKLYYGEIERTLDPPREVERIWVLDDACPMVARMLTIPRSELAELKGEDVPRLHEYTVREEYFRLRQFVGDTLEDLVLEAGLRIARWLERGGAYLTLLAERRANSSAPWGPSS